MSRYVLVVACCMAALLGCQRPVEGAPAAGSIVDTLPLSLARVEQISGVERFNRDIDTDLPTPSDYLPDGPCRTLGDQNLAYGNTWTGFRSVADTADLAASPLSPVVSVVQNIVGYSDENAAREVFDRRIEDVMACAALNIPGLGGTVSRPDDRTAVWVDDGMAMVFAIKSSILVDASAVALPDSERIASDISRRILARIQ